MVTEGRPLAGVGALVTGGSGGIGRAAALHLARDGAVVTLMGRTQSTLDEAVASIEDAVGDGASVAAYVGDATMAGDVRAASTRRRLGASASASAWPSSVAAARPRRC